MTNPKLLRGRHSQHGACYVVASVTARRRPLFRDPRLARCVVDEIERAARSVESLAWVVMPDHVHWLFALGDGNLGRIMQAMKSRSARTIHEVAQTRGPLWQSGYYDHRLRDDEDLLRQARYIVANPLRAGLVKHLGEYPFWWCLWVDGAWDL